ncbi:hypothetical protein, partial [Afifella pfennigii]|uniref:hypothetical protein n=1 Tax=Afifella pfennigii TaxID=209897 RepID=UPI001AEC13EE
QPAARSLTSTQSSQTLQSVMASEVPKYLTTDNLDAWIDKHRQIASPQFQTLPLPVKRSRGRPTIAEQIESHAA